MQALVLAGGEGTRLRPLTLTRPKPALTLVDRPFLRFMIDWLGRHGVDEVLVACGFRADDVRAAIGDSVPGGPAIRYLEEPEPLGTAGPIRLAAEEGALAERFLMLNGDVLTDLDLGALQAFHAERKGIATLGLYPVADPSAYGLVRHADDGSVTEFLEKPGPVGAATEPPPAPAILAGAGPAYEVNAGAYVLERGVVDLIPGGRAVSIEREIFPQLVGSGLYGLRLEGYWMDIGTPERYLRASWDILAGRVATEVQERMNGDGVGVDEHAEVDGAAVLSGPVLIDAAARVGAAVLGPCAVIGADCEIDEGARIGGSVLHANCLVGADAAIEDAIIGAGATIGAGASIESGAVLGEGASVAPGAVVEHDARIEPGGVA